MADAGTHMDVPSLARIGGGEVYRRLERTVGGLAVTIACVELNDTNPTGVPRWDIQGAFND